MVRREKNNSEFTQRIEKALVYAGENGFLPARKDGSVTNRTLAEAVTQQGSKISEPGVWKWRNGEGMPDALKIGLLSDLLHVRAEWLEYGVGPMVNDGATGNVTGYKPHFAGHRYPLISWVSAGNWSEALEPYRIDEIDVWPETTEDVSEASFWLMVKGDSMTSPSGVSIPEGTMILVDPAKEPINGSLVVAKLEFENEATFKKYVQDAGHQYLKPLNPEYHMQQINSTCRIIGVVVEAKLRLH